MVKKADAPKEKTAALVKSLRNRFETFRTNADIRLAAIRKLEEEFKKNKTPDIHSQETTNLSSVANKF